MRVLWTVLLLFVVTTGFSQEINWMTMDEALAAQKKEPRKIFMDAYTTWCGPCKMMDKNTFTNPGVIDYLNKNYYAVKFNAEGEESVTYKGHTYTNPNYRPERKGRNAQHLFANALSVRAYPTIVFFKEDGELIQAIPGYRNPQQIEIFLKMIHNDDYLKITTEDAWKSYQENFTNTF